MSQNPCPSCGYCPACKRQGVQPTPHYPVWVYPYWQIPQTAQPWPYAPITITSTTTGTSVA